MLCAFNAVPCALITSCLPCSLRLKLQRSWKPPLSQEELDDHKRKKKGKKAKESKDTKEEEHSEEEEKQPFRP